MDGVEDVTVLQARFDETKASAALTLAADDHATKALRIEPRALVQLPRGPPRKFRVGLMDEYTVLRHGKLPV
ncbi:hypothetical protein NRB_11940 [Novosphingobium sp. 11B]